MLVYLCQTEYIKIPTLLRILLMFVTISLLKITNGMIGFQMDGHFQVVQPVLIVFMHGKIVQALVNQLIMNYAVVLVIYLTIQLYILRQWETVHLNY